MYGYNPVKKGGKYMLQIISKNGKVKCVTTVPYPASIIRDMKKAGYKIVVKEG